MPRLFVAVDLQDQVKAAVAALRCELPGARWCPVEQLHLTLRFIGEVDDGTFASIKKVLGSVVVTEFPLTLRGVGHFPPGKHPRVLWVGMDPSPLLMTLQQQIEASLAELGLPREERRFSPHITLARLHDTNPAAVTAFEARHLDFSCPTFSVGEFYLYSSVLNRSGAIHRREATYRSE